jgi:hypothetical protein
VTVFEGRPEGVSEGQLTIHHPRLYGINSDEHLVAPTVSGSDGTNESVISRHEYAGFDQPVAKVDEDSIPEHRRFGYHKWIEMKRSAAGDLYATYSAMQIPTDLDTEPLRGTWEIFFKNFSQTSVSDPAIRLTDNNAIPYIQPVSVVDASDTVHLVYAGLVNDVFQLHYRRSLDPAKTTWTDPLVITQSITGAWEPSIVESRGVIHVVYTDYDVGNGDIFHLTIRNDQVDTGPANFSFTSGISRNPKLLKPRFYDHLHLVWEEEDTVQGGFKLRREMFFR